MRSNEKMIMDFWKSGLIIADKGLLFKQQKLF